MPHRHARIVFFEQQSCHRSYCVFRHQLPNEHDASLGRPSYIETKVHFLEVLVEWYGESENSRAVELEADQAEVCLSFERVQLRARGNEAYRRSRAHRVVEHQQIIPLGG